MTIEAPSHSGNNMGGVQGSEPLTAPPAPARSETSYSPLPMAIPAGIRARKTVIWPAGQGQGTGPVTTTTPGRFAGPATPGNRRFIVMTDAALLGWITA